VAAHEVDHQVFDAWELSRRVRPTTMPLVAEGLWMAHVGFVHDDALGYEALVVAGAIGDGWLEIQRGLAFDRQDVALGQDTYRQGGRQDQQHDGDGVGLPPIPHRGSLTRRHRHARRACHARGTRGPEEHRGTFCGVGVAGEPAVRCPSGRPVRDGDPTDVPGDGADPRRTEGNHDR
jgi:hypothetical protein